MNILVIPVQSISDLITNSSSEVFILETEKTCEEVNNILSTFTSGFNYPEVFSLKDYREWRKKLRNGEVKDDWSYPGTIFSIAEGWFKDPEDEEDLLDYREDFLFYPYEIIKWDGWVSRVCSSDYKESIQDAFLDYLNNNWDKVSDKINKVLIDYGKSSISSIDWKTLRQYSYQFRNGLRDTIREFLKSYDGPKPSVWDIEKNEDVRELDGKVLVVSSDDNSIPFDTWDKINDLFNGWNMHLG